MEQGGKTANRNGKAMESQVRQCLISAGYTEITPDEKKLLVRRDGTLDRTDKWFCQQLRLERNMYEAKSTIDFYVYHPELYPEGLHIEVKWQGSAGSVDEKYVFTVLSLVKCRGDKIMVLDGGGARQGAIRWIKQQERKQTNRFKFFTLTEFMKWSQRSL